MSLSEPKKKQQKTMKKQSPLMRCESVELEKNPIVEEEKNHRMPLPLTTSTTSESTMTMDQKTTLKHPKGHKVKNLSDIWKTMDSQDFLHLSDTLTLNDVWLQPISVEPVKGAYAAVNFIEVVFAAHIKTRRSQHKMALDDLVKMLYLNDCLQYDMQNIPRPEFNDWVKEKTALCVKAIGLEESNNRSKFCNFIITEDRDFTFYPAYLHQHFGIFFRKSAYHSYKTESDVSTSEIKITNPSIIKCSTIKGNFEYIIEARIFPLPYEWMINTAPGNSSMVDRSQPPTELDIQESQIF